MDQETKQAKKKQYDIQYAKENLKRIPLDVPKATYDEIKAHAAAHSESVNVFIKRAITETMQRDQADSLPATSTPEEIAFDTCVDESKPDPHRTARAMIEDSIERGESVSSIPDWYIEEVRDNADKREKLLSYALDHTDEDDSFKKIIRLFKGMV